MRSIRTFNYISQIEHTYLPLNSTYISFNESTAHAQVLRKSIKRKNFLHTLLAERFRTYDTIRYDTVYLRAFKIWRDSQPNLVHSTKTKNKEKLKTKTE